MKQTLIALAVLGMFSGAAQAQVLVGSGSSGAPDGTNTAVGYIAQAWGTNNATALGSFSGASAPSSTALGSQAIASGNSSLAVGEGAQATASASTAVGSGSIVSVYGGSAFGYGSAVGAGGTESVAIGYGSSATEANAVSFGGGLLGAPMTRRLVNVSDGIAATDAATVGQVQTVQGIVNNVINGTTDLGNAKVGGQTLSSWVSQIGAGGGGGTVDTTARTAAATAQTTADTALATAGTALTTAVSADTKATTALTTANQTKALFDDFSSKVDQRFDAMSSRMDTMTKEYRAGIAAAMAGTHSVMSAAQAGGIGVGLAAFNGQTAISMGLARQVGNMSVNASVSHSKGPTGAGIGVGWRLN